MSIRHDHEHRGSFAGGQAAKEQHPETARPATGITRRTTLTAATRDSLRSVGRCRVTSGI